MKAKGWVTMAVAVVVVGTGTCVLAGAMANKQNTELTTFSSSVSEAAVTEEGGTWEDGSAKTEDKKYVIEMDEGNYLEKTEADMSPERATNIAVREIEKAFGSITVEKVTGVGLIGYDHNRRLGEGCRAYNGMICCEGDVIYEFVVNSINGRVLSMMKIPNRIDPMETYTSRYEELGEKLKLKKGKEKYYEIARNFSSQNYKEGDLGETDVRAVVCAGGDHYFHSSWKIIAVEAEFLTQNSEQYSVTIDPETDEVIGWDLLIPPV